MTSAINPQNIDGLYPIAGQDNNSQGFRDNFTNTKTNFQYAADEITDLQNKVVLKSALLGTTLNNDMGGSPLSNAQLQDMSWTLRDFGTVSGSQTINYVLGQYQTLTTNGTVNLFFSNFPTAGITGVVNLQVTVTNVAYQLVLPAQVTGGLTGIQGLSGLTITFAQIGTYNFSFVSNDGGSNITIFDLNRPLNYYTNAVTINDNTTSFSTVTGSLVTAGGVGIGGNLYVAGTIFGTVTSATESVAGNITGGNILTAGYVSATGNVFGGNVVFGSGIVSGTGNITGGNVITGGLITATGNISGGNLRATGSIKSSSSSGGIGYGPGAGSTVTQSTNKSTAVTINTVCGNIIMSSDNLATDTVVTFTMNNSSISSTDILILNHISGGTAGAYMLNAQPGVGNAQINVRNVTSGDLAQAITIGFAVIKGVTS